MDEPEGRRCSAHRRIGDCRVGVAAAGLFEGGDDSAGRESSAAQDAAYLENVRLLAAATAPFQNDVGDSRLVELGHLVCDGFDRGESWTEMGKLLRAAERPNIKQQQLVVIPAATGTYCPEYAPTLRLRTN